MFEIAPDLQKLFYFSDDELDDNHPGLRKHAMQVMEKIDGAIGLLDEEEELKEELVGLGIVHHMSNVNVGSFAVSIGFRLIMYNVFAISILHDGRLFLRVAN